MTQPPRILVVDDNLSMAEMVAEWLADVGYECVAAGSGREGLRRLTSEPFAALVTDLRMPDVDGFELLAISKKEAPHRPVIVMTAHGAQGTAIESIRRGAYRFLTKPFKAAELSHHLGRALANTETGGAVTGAERAAEWKQRCP